MTKRSDGYTPEWTETEAAQVERPLVGTADYADGQRLWLGTQSRPWQTLAVVPVEQNMSTYEIASRITALGLHHGECIGLADLRDVQLNRVSAFLEVTRLLVSRGRRVVFAMRSIKENLATIPLARAADGVVLCLSLGSTSIESTEETIDQIGKERLVGSMLIRKPKGGFRAPALAPSLRLLEAHS